MAKQAVDQSTQELNLAVEWPALDGAIREIEQLKDRMLNMHASYTEWHNKRTELKAAGVNWAGTTYKDGNGLPR